MNPHDISKRNTEVPEIDATFASNEESEFFFDYLEPNNIINEDNEIVDPSEPVDSSEPDRLMSCICPKCAEKTDVDLAQVSENGFIIFCSHCNKEIQIIRESCVCRAKRKSYEINCANCGKQLDQHAHCSSCGKFCPDYLVTVNPGDARIKARKEFFSKKWAAIRDLNISFKSISFGRSQDIAHAYSPARSTFKSTSEASSLQFRKPAILAIFFVVAVALIATGVSAYNSHKAGQIYADNYFKSLYCIKTGLDANIQTCASLKTEWESMSVSSKSYSPRISNKDETMSIKLNGEIDKYLQKMGAPPKEYLPANESLMKIHNIYLESDTLMFSKPSTLQEFSNSIDSLNKKMKQASQELKSSLPDSLKQGMVNAKLKYKGLNDF